MKRITNITPLKAKKAEKVKLAAYCRVSSNSADQLHSYAAQIRYYSEYAKQHTEYELVDIYADEGLTGTEMTKRDELMRLLKDCRQGKVDRVIVKSVSRLARNTEDFLITIRMLKDIGVSVYFEEQGIDTNKLNAEMIATFPGMVAQQESMAISGNLRWGIQKRMREGRFRCSHPPYGYELKNGEFVIYEPEAKIIRRIYEQYLQGVGQQSIANQLMKEGVPRRNGYRTWTKRAVHYILINEKYIGDALFQKTYTTNHLPFRQKTNKGELAQYYVEEYNPAIIDKETYAAVRELMNSRQRKKGERASATIYPLTGLIHCPECGCLFRRREVRGKTYWCCSTAMLGTGKCKGKRVKEQTVYNAFTDMAYKLQDKREFILKRVIDKFETMQRAASQANTRVCEIDKEVADLSAKNLFITRLYTSGVLSVSDYTAQTSEINYKIAELRRERKKQLAEEEETVINDLKLLDEIIEGYQLKGGFSLELFSQIVEDVKINDRTEIVFHLLGGLVLRQRVKNRGRCQAI